jgi:Lrp/AsnC family transcriptional regulator, regulator for asnA, asnC and gidA
MSASCTTLWILSDRTRPDKGFRGSRRRNQRNQPKIRPFLLTRDGPDCEDQPVNMRNGRGERPGTQLDAVSKAIIEQLQQDGRRSYAAIGKVVGLSEAAVRQRVQRLVDSGVMQVVAVTDPLELGFARQAMIGIKAQGELDGIADKLAAMDEVDYVVITAGSYDLLAEVVCESDERLLDVLSTRIRTIDGVVSTETFMYLKLRKQTYSWGVR